MLHVFPSRQVDVGAREHRVENGVTDVLLCGESKSYRIQRRDTLSPFLFFVIFTCHRLWHET